MQQDQQGRPLSDDGQWVWNGTQWEAAGGSSPARSQASGGRPVGGSGPETLVVPRPADPVQGQADTAAQAENPDAVSNAKPRSSRSSAFGTTATGGPGPRPGSRLPDLSSNRNRLIAGIGAALVVLVLILVVVLVVAGGGSGKTRTAAAPGTAVPSAPAASPAASVPASTPSTFARPSGAAAALGPALGLYTCRVKDKATGMDKIVGTFTLTGSKYTTTFGGSGDWAYDQAARGVVFIGRDLSDFDGRFDPASGRVALTAKTDKSLVVTCGQ